MIVKQNKNNIKIDFAKTLDINHRIFNYQVQDKTKQIEFGKGKETSVRRMLCGENIIDGQVVKRIDGLIFVARSSDSETELNLIQGVAMQSGLAGEYIDVLLYGLGRVPQSLDDGLLFLGLDGFLKNTYEGNIVEIGYKVGSEILVYQKKDVIILEV